MDQHKRLYRTTPLQNAWSVRLGVMLVECQRFIYLFIWLFITYLLSMLQISCFTDIISLINIVLVSQKAPFSLRITNNQTQELNVNSVSGGDWSLYQLIKTIFATEEELASILLRITTTINLFLLKESQTISLFFL